jgi:hypothetical protein
VQLGYRDAGRLILIKPQLMVKTKFLLCIKNDGYAASLELRKVYVRVADKKAEAQNLVRVIDESGEDYLYPFAYFVAVAFSQKVMEAVAAAV